MSNSRMQRLLIITIGLFGSNLLFGDQLDPKKIERNFHYDLLASDVGCWITGQCRGLISDQPNRDIVEQIDRFLQSAKKSVDIAIYGLRNQDWFLDRLKKLRGRGVRIRATLDQQTGALGDWQQSSNFPYPDAHKLLATLGTRSVRPDVNEDNTPRTGSIMHNKFIVVDAERVWLGSMNLSDTGAGTEYNANTAIIVRSKEIASLFVDEFNQMFELRRYSRKKLRRHRRQSFKFRDGTTAKVFFAPQDSPAYSAIIPFIQNAKHTLDIGMFYLTHAVVADEIVVAKERGVAVRIINDASAARNKHSQIRFLRRNKVPVLVENWGGKMHMKTAIADGRHSLIGSMNWSEQGSTQNDENILVIENNSHLAGSLTDYFDFLWDSLPGSHGKPGKDPRAEGPESINSCFDGINNDYVGGVDQRSVTCRGTKGP